MGVVNSINESLDNSRVGAPASQQNIKKKGSDDIQNNFLTLLLTQMKNQDPTNPMQNNELTTQLAQISTVQGVEKLNETVSGLTGQLHASQALNATKLVGQGVMIAGNKITLYEKKMLRQLRLAPMKPFLPHLVLN
ncbi:flagellar hook capping FlgD N-terminal domain-containing protein [Arsenophonus nasoniae]|uniref:Basal-body rod modification protein FlgD n=1 Tax=Arsenophonus nasoniae TaxID=638 RepID=A0A4P7KWC8_9GAMM|nr:flagellar hook capping FlgD N-terminal domain-containing protein [Arsenophonus nasoniae]QBY42940.1 Basal-body rod modification protein FlgD [Arsenophonus nasoniae]WGM06992.1 flagellar hook capping FlgD N-terminal domain-containing protein [Arsenophonus nasoniae]WGM11873.1 flagellar hook capping FlgD N-terminal domain-containing protein [Arsenophonus nasoniae]WGM16559.1 flagellar hook capping FlgD N-terminal domain-containing protein [Arsenophonus nasoniae]